MQIVGTKICGQKTSETTFFATETLNILFNQLYLYLTLFIFLMIFSKGVGFRLCLFLLCMFECLMSHWHVLWSSLVRRHTSAQSHHTASISGTAFYNYGIILYCLSSLWLHCLSAKTCGFFLCKILKKRLAVGGKFRTPWEKT